MAEPSDHVVKVVDSLIYKRDSLHKEQTNSSVPSIDSDISTLPPALTTELKKSKSTKKKKSTKSSSKFQDSPSLLDTTASYLSDDGDNRDDDTSAGGDDWESSDSVVAKLRRELTDAKMELEIEKTSKRKREKNLIRLAKEMDKRVSYDKAKDKKIEELEETIADLQQRLQNKTTLALVEIPALRAQLEQRTKELDDCVLRASRKNLNTPWKSSLGALRSIVFVLVTVVPLAILTAAGTKLPALSISNFICTAIPTGMIIETTLLSTPQQFEPPFFVPTNYKRSLYATLCPGRPYVIARVEDSKLVLIDSTGKKATHKVPNGFSVGFESITLLDDKKPKSRRTIPNPWYH